MSDLKLGNPAVVGLAGFGMTTFILQCHNLGWCGVAPVIWLGLVFGGTAQLIAGILEFKTGNNFGFCAFTGYGAFWIALCLMLVFGTNAGIKAAYPVMGFVDKDLGFFLGIWGFFTFLLFIASMKHNGTLAFIFLTLFLGFAGLTIEKLTGSEGAGVFAAWDLIICALSAFYLMFVAVCGEAGIKLPVGGPWIKSNNG